MENIATPLSPKNATAGAVTKRHGTGVAGIDKALFDAFVSVEGTLPDAKQQRGNKGGIAEKIAPHEANKPVITAKKPLPAPAEKPQPDEDKNANDELLVVADTSENDKRIAVSSVKALPVAELALRKALQDPETLAKLKKLMNLDDSASEEDVLKLCMSHMREILDFASSLRKDGLLLNANGEPLKLDEPIDIIDAVTQAIAALVNQQQAKLSEAERKLREALLELSIMGTTPAGDDAVDAAVAKNLDAVADWKAAVAVANEGAPEGDVAKAAAAADKPVNKAHNQSDAPHPLDVRSAQNVAAGGRSDANLVNSQASAGQTLPLLPTQLTGGQQRLPVANQNWLGSSNLDAIARPVSASNIADAATKLARAASRTTSLPQVYEQVSVRLNRMAKAGEKSMTVQLNPSELGRVEVKLEFGKDASVSARIMADNQQTLDLLQRDSKALERALTDAGLKLDQNSLQFDLRHGGDNHGSKFEAALENRRYWQENRADAPLVSDEILINVSPAGVADGRLDIQV